jgi:hypothetical protein
MSNFISIFIEEHGQAPAFNIFESCEQVAKRFVSSKENKNSIEGFLLILVINQNRMMIQIMRNQQVFNSMNYRMLLFFLYSQKLSK